MLGKLDELGRPGRGGVRAIRRLLKERDPAQAPSESYMETLCNRVFRRAGLPKVTAQRVVYDDGAYVGRLDFEHPDRDLVLEAHSYRFHSSHRAWHRDVERWNRLRAMGKRIVILTWREVRFNPDKVVADIRRELQKDQLFSL